ncbi:hypothetical protein C8J56DRAFT_1158139 [Mycena floridula]|nr:hypothetical protein C8J56DRAFT_1158139 [Mycena floridula]
MAVSETQRKHILSNFQTTIRAEPLASPSTFAGHSCQIHPPSFLSPTYPGQTLVGILFDGSHLPSRGLVDFETLMFRLPTHLESSLIPPPREQVAPGSTTPGPSSSSPSSSRSPPFSNRNFNNSPWRGEFVVSGLRPSDQGSNVEIKVTGVEIEGNCSARSHSQMSLWPSTLFFSIPQTRSDNAVSAGASSMAHAQAQASRARTQSHSTRIIQLDTMHAWLAQYQQQSQQSLPMVTFIPDRLRDPNAQQVNLAHFRNLSRVLWESRTVAMVPWNTPTGTGTINFGSSSGGILIYPAQNSSTLLVGAVFIDQPFPDLATASPSPSLTSPTPHHSIYQPQLHISTSVSTAYGPSTYSPATISPVQSRSSHSPIASTHQPGSQRQLHPYQRHQSQSLSPVSSVESHQTIITPISRHYSRPDDQSQYRYPMNMPVSAQRTAYLPPAPPMLAPLPQTVGSTGNWPEDEYDGSAQGQSSSSGGAGQSSHGGQGHYGQ